VALGGIGITGRLAEVAAFSGPVIASCASITVGWVSGFLDPAPWAPSATDKHPQPRPLTRQPGDPDPPGNPSRRNKKFPSSESFHCMRVWSCQELNKFYVS